MTESTSATPQRDIAFAVDRLGLNSAPEVLEAAWPAIERGRHAALIAGPGSGKEVLYGLAVARRCTADVGVQALILAATREEASRSAVVATRLTAEDGMRCAVLPSGRRSPASSPTDTTRVVAVAGRPSDILLEVRSGRFSLADLNLLVLDGLETLELAGQWAAVEAILDTMQPGAVKVAVAQTTGGRLQELLKHRLPRAVRWPKELFDAKTTLTVGEPPLRCAVEVEFENRMDLVAAALDAAASDDACLQCADVSQVEAAAAALAARGFRVAGVTGVEGIRVGSATDPAPASTVAVALGLPPDLESLRAWLGSSSIRVAVVEPLRLGQLEVMARRVGWPVQRFGLPPATPEMDSVEQFRATVGVEVQRADIGAELLLLEPLFRSYGTAAVAAALASLLRRREPTGMKPWPDMEADSGMGIRASPGAEVGTRPAWTRVYVDVGRRDGARASDLVGAITGETKAAGGQIGKIEIRNSFALVDIDSQIVDDVIRDLSGSVIRGRTVSARLDRESR